MSDGHERRINERTDCDIAAKIELSDRLAIACRIKDLSAAGFRIEIAETTHLPEEFDLLVPVIESTFRRYRAKMVWRNADAVGGEFITPHAQ